jgi:hypothetical protein
MKNINHPTLIAELPDDLRFKIEAKFDGYGKASLRVTSRIDDTRLLNIVSLTIRVTTELKGKYALGPFLYCFW